MSVYRKYNQFLTSVNENVQQAKVYLKRLALDKKKEEFKKTNPDATSDEISKITLSEEEGRDAERNKMFQSIKTITNNDNYTFLLTKIFFEETGGQESDLQQIENLYSTIQKNIVTDNIITPSGDKQFKTRRGLPKNIEMYVNPERFLKDKVNQQEYDEFTKRGDGTPKNISEMILDDIVRSESLRYFVNFYNKLIPKQKEFVDKANKLQKERLINIARRFSEIGLDEDGEIDLENQKHLQDTFFSKIKDYTRLDDLIYGCNRALKAAENVNINIFLKKINKVNELLGEKNGAKIIYFENNILVIDVFTFIANEILNGHTGHCIVRGVNSWDSYVKDFGKQYYIYNYNLDSDDNMSVIGLTINEEGKITYAHAFDDKNLLSNIEKIIEDLGLQRSLFRPMSEEEINTKKRKIEADKKIILPNLSLEDLKTYLDDGADPNAKVGEPLRNMIKSNNLEGARYLLERNANPNTKSDYGSNSRNMSVEAKSTDMLKLLVEFGGDLDEDLLSEENLYSLKAIGTKPAHTLETSQQMIEYLLKQGMDPNLDRGQPFRLAAKFGRDDLMQMFCNYANNISSKKSTNKNAKILEMISSRDELALKLACEYGQLNSIKFIFNKYKELRVPSFTNSESFEAEKEDLIAYTNKSKASRLSKENFEKTIAFIKNYNLANESKRFSNFKYFKY